ncbi:MAG: hypothetical protein AVDCRST_MAG78-1284 [uncultured Rubrobacteraceae bacterium]|uniref:Uncharacterized protein n=1 Tax=uncultured Rubrobacteraceae bacterium TaxID=349277 RepID=A0A6J4PV25_9ACTN|nr:MAG: hypothetical protein AVDCRST_MAG78-1284 [uncultured Rubrobacteraceae bacterium]
MPSSKGAPALDYLLLILPAFGHPLGFALGCTTVLLTMLAGLLLARTLPPSCRSPFILANATPLYEPFVR